MSIFFKSGANRGLVGSRDVRNAVVKRLEERFAGQESPGAAGHDLGKIETADGEFRLIARHAVDLVVIGERRRSVLLIKRSFPPGAGKWALPGGFIDQGEAPADAALREAQEEAGLISGLCRRSGISAGQLARRLEALPPWRYSRRFDIRSTDWLAAPIKLGAKVTLRPGNLMAVTTQPFVLRLPEIDVSALSSGDDAAGIAVRPVCEIERRELGVGDHHAIILGAIRVANRAGPQK